MAIPNHARRYFEAQRSAAEINRPDAFSHCYGIVLHHRAQWWLVEFPELDTAPIAAHRLSGKMTPAMHDWLRREAGDPRLENDIATLHPDGRCWSGEFSRSPTKHDPNMFDIDAHPWGSEVGELEARLARTMVDILIRPLPAGFISVFTALPDSDEPVLAIRRSGYICATFELMTARYMPTYRPRSPWRDISGDAVSDSGSDILGWKSARDWLTPIEVAPASESAPVDAFAECHVTPPDVAARMVSYLGEVGDYLTLEPSAGTGCLSRALIESGHSRCELVQVERHNDLSGRLNAFGTVIYRCFLDYAAEVRGRVQFPRIIMNPPFSHAREHVAAARSLMGAHGHAEAPTLVALVPIGFEADHMETLEYLPDDTFGAATVRTKIIRIRAGADT